MAAAEAARAYLRTYFITITTCILTGGLILAPYSLWWLCQSGDSALDKVVAAQASGSFVIFGSGVSQDFVDYKLRLYEAVRPEIAAIGSSRVMQFRGTWFTRKFLNMGGVAGNLAVLRSTIEEMLRIHTPRAVIIGIDFWWFLPQWEANPQAHAPPTSGSYNYGLDSLKKPWEWLLTGKISLADFLAPVLGFFGKGFRTDRYGIMAQQSDDGFGPDGAWNYTGEITGQKPAPDYKFHDTLLNIERGIKAFYHSRPDQTGPDIRHLHIFAQIIGLLRKNGVQTFVFMPPLAQAVYNAMRKAPYAHLFQLQSQLDRLGIPTLDFSNPAGLKSNDCEFVDGFHGGEITYARILRQLALHEPGLLKYINMKKLNEVIVRWSGHAQAANPQLTLRSEVDFLGLGCHKTSPPTP